MVIDMDIVNISILYFLYFYYYKFIRVENMFECLLI